MRRGFNPRSPLWNALFAVMAIPTTRPSIEIFGFHLVESQEERRSLEISSQKARVYKTENLMTLDAVRTLFWGKGPRPFEVRGDFALVNSDTQDLEIPTHANVMSPDGFLFKTTDLAYKADKRLISSDQLVEGRQVGGAKREAGSNVKITGKGLLINLPENTYEIKSSVRTEQKTGPDKSLVITASNLVIYPDNQNARFTKIVQVKSPEFRLRGDRLVTTFDRADPEGPLSIRQLVMDSPQPKQKISAELKSLKIVSRGLTIDIDPKGGGLQKSEAIGQAEAETTDGIRMLAESLISDTEAGASRIRLKGNVSIFTGQRKGTCQDALFYPDTGEIVLEHGASVTHEDQLIQGEKIRFSTKRSDIVVEKVRGSMDHKKMNH